MILERVSIFTFRVDLKRPLHFSQGTVDHRTGFLLRLTSDQGHSGWGECSPLPGYSLDAPETALESLRVFRRAMRGVQIPPRTEELSGAFAEWLGDLEISAAARFAVETAVLALLANERSTTPAQLCAARPVTFIPVNGLISGRGDEIDTEVDRLLKAGYTTAKLKVGARTIEEDVEITRRVWDKLRESCVLRLDANKAWTFDDALRFASGIADCRIDYLEEPLQDIGRLAEFASAASLPVALDESLIGLSPEDVQPLQNVTALVIRPTVLGGLEQSMKFIRRAKQVGITPVISSAVESAVGIAALANLAAASGPDPAPSGLDTLTWFEQQPTSMPVEIIKGRIDITSAHKSGQAVDQSVIEDVTDG